MRASSTRCYQRKKGELLGLADLNAKPLSTDLVGRVCRGRRIVGKVTAGAGGGGGRAGVETEAAAVGPAAP